MASANQTLPYSTVTPLPSGDAFAATGIADVVVFAGPSSKGPLNTPTLLGAQDTDTLVSTFGTGRAVKVAARSMSKVAANVVFLRLATASVSATISTPVKALGVSSTWTGVVSGTPLDGFDVVVNFVLGGTTGTGPVDYQVSLDGGATFGTTQHLATGTSITLTGTGLTIALGSAKVVTTGDSIAFYTVPASSAVLPTTFTGTGTSVVSVSGAPNDAYEVAFKVIAGGTIGTTGITYQVSLDYGAPSTTWTPTTALGTASSLALNDGPLSQEPTGLTLAFAAGTLVAGDLLTFKTTAPAYDSSGVTAGLAKLKAWNGTWTWVRLVGPVTESLGATVSGIIGAWDASNLPSWGVVDARDRGTNESLAAWSARIDADWTPYTSIYVGYSKGMARMTDPINSRSTRLPAMDACVPRAMGLPIQVDWGEFDLGPLPADVSITDANNQIVEYNAETDPTGVTMGAIALRTWAGEVGVYPAGACLPGPDNDYKRVPLRRVKCVADRVLAAALRADVLKGLRIIPAGTPNQKLAGYPPLVAGRDFEAADIAKVNRVVTERLKAAIVTTGMATSCAYQMDPTPIQLGGGAVKRTGKLQINGLEYLVANVATSQYVK